MGDYEGKYLTKVFIFAIMPCKNKHRLL